LFLQSHRDDFEGVEDGLWDLMLARVESAQKKYGDSAVWMTNAELITMASEELADATFYQSLLYYRGELTNKP
jgi:hypothetical protein